MDDYIDRLLEAIRDGVKNSDLAEKHNLKVAFMSPAMVGAPHAYAALQIDTETSEVPAVIVVVT